MALRGNVSPPALPRGPDEAGGHKGEEGEEGEEEGEGETKEEGHGEGKTATSRGGRVLLGTRTVIGESFDNADFETREALALWRESERKIQEVTMHSEMRQIKSTFPAPPDDLRFKIDLDWICHPNSISIVLVLNLTACPACAGSSF